MNYLERKRNHLLAAAIIGIFIDIFVFKFTSDFVVLLLTLAWIGAVAGWRLEGRFSIAGALVFLTMTPFLLILKKDPLAEKTAIWAYMFLVVGVVQQLIELKKEPQGWQDFGEFAANAKKIINGEMGEIREIGLRGEADKIGGKIRRFWERLRADWRLSRLKKQTKLWKRLALAVVAAGERLLVFLGRRWQEFALGGLGLLAGWGLAREIGFYRWFFEEHFWSEFAGRLLIWLAVFWLAAVVFLFLLRKRGAVLNKRKIFLIAVLFVFWRGDKIIFSRARAGFEFKPYIINISPEIASRYMEVKIKGRNFKDMPFQGKVLLNGKEQRVIKWSDRLVVIEIDPERSQSGKMAVENDYQKGSRQSNLVEFTYFDSKTATPEEKERFWEALKEAR